MSKSPLNLNQRVPKGVRKRWLRNFGVSILLLVVATTLIVSWLVATALIAPSNVSLGKPPSDLPIDSIQLTTTNGNTIHGWRIPIEDAKATIVLLHPLRSDRRSMVGRARLFHQHGYSLLLFDLQAHGESPGKQITFGYRESRDVEAIVDFVSNEYPEHKIGIVGRSLGGAATVLSGVDVDAIVLESVYGNIESAVHNRVAMRVGPLHHVLAPLLIWQIRPRLGISPSLLRPEDRISELNCPILIAAGDADRHTTLAETKNLYAQAGGRKRLSIFEGAGHEDLLQYDSEKYRQEILQFLNHHLMHP